VACIERFAIDGGFQGRFKREPVDLLRRNENHASREALGAVREALPDDRSTPKARLSRRLRKRLDILNRTRHLEEVVAGAVKIEGLVNHDRPWGAVGLECNEDPFAVGHGPRKNALGAAAPSKQALRADPSLDRVPGARKRHLGSGAGNARPGGTDETDADQDRAEDRYDTVHPSNVHTSLPASPRVGMARVRDAD
jgi:hypothetical protein